MKHLSPTLILTLIAALLAPPLHAGPAPWYQWRSKADGKLACSQVALGAGWEKFDGPYRDARCAFRLPAK
jgi:hypothetical protein